jgi:transposase-like protein
MVLEHRGEYPSEWAALGSISAEVGVTRETMRSWVRRAEVDGGLRSGMTSSERERIRDLEREVRELRRANEIRRAAQFFRAGARPATAQVVKFIATNNERWRVEPICKVLQFARATYYAAGTGPPSAREVRDRELKVQIQRTWEENPRLRGGQRMGPVAARRAVGGPLRGGPANA